MSVLNQSKPVIPAWLIWIQCIAFVVLYAVWILPEIVGIRNTALVVGALAGLYPIYRYRAALWAKRAIPIWLIITLFAWATFHLFFLSQDYAAQFLEYKRIWKYAAIGAIFALGLGISLVDAKNDADHSTGVFKTCPYWAIIYLGLCMPSLVYLVKYILSANGVDWGLSVPAYLKIYGSSERYYVPKSDYVAFCLPSFAIALGRLKVLFQEKFSFSEWVISLGVNGGLIFATLLVFHEQNIKNGMAYAFMCVVVFILLLIFQSPQKSRVWRGLIVITIVTITIFLLSKHLQKNESWKTLIADAKVALQTDQYQHWKYAGKKGYPKNSYGLEVSVSNYERVAWLKIGLELSGQMPQGYGLIEDSFRSMAIAKWPEASPNLSHSHSGWLDVVLAVGWPGFILIFSALLCLLMQYTFIAGPWSQVVFWGPLSIMLLWCTTEVSATVTFAALIFWVCLCSGLSINTKSRNYHSFLDGKNDFKDIAL